MNKDPYIVVGPGRSGTSTVARILHVKMGISMGERFPDPDVYNADGYYEDLAFKELNRNFVRGAINYPDWFKGVYKLIDKRASTGKPWGFKNIRLTTLLGNYLVMLDHPRIIRCQRDPLLTAKSKMKMFNNTPMFAAFSVVHKNRSLDKILGGKDHLVIEFGEERKSDEEIIEEILLKWPTDQMPT